MKASSVDVFMQTTWARHGRDRVEKLVELRKRLYSAQLDHYPPLMECLLAFDAANGDMARAEELLRIKLGDPWNTDQYSDLQVTRVPSATYSLPVACAKCGVEFKAGDTVLGQSTGGPWSWFHGECAQAGGQLSSATEAPGV